MAASLNLILLELALVLSATLILLNSGTAALLFSSIFFIIFCVTHMLNSGFAMLSIVLLLAEIHVFYIIACISVSINSYDFIMINNIRSSKLLNSLKFFFIFSFFILFILIGGPADSIYLNNFYAIDLLLDVSLTRTTGYWLVQLPLLRVLLLCYLNIYAFEFFILNVFMFAVVFVFFEITVSLNKAVFMAQLGKRVAGVSELKLSKTFIRRQSSSRQHRRRPLTRVLRIKSRVSKSSRLFDVNNLGNIKN